MQLKKIEMQGFKSFAGKTEVDFLEGITTIVGPNGSGKSNIADAVRWVLGEQSAKVLRGTKMEDVIFAGTENRKRVGFAEVSLYLDNSDGSLPIDYSEVVVTRRVFRSGESGYLINSNECRLKDVQELFMDTGIGKDGYSIIGQGKIDEILSNKSEERRAIFEEASGIMKYKTRKEEASKKLADTDINLSRVSDILNEIEKILIRDKELFGEIQKGTPDEPAVSLESTHHFYKNVSGKPLVRPAWYYDVEQQGEGIVDIATHLVDLVTGSASLKWFWIIQKMLSWSLQIIGRQI